MFLAISLHNFQYFSHKMHIHSSLLSTPNGEWHTWSFLTRLQFRRKSYDTLYDMHETSIVIKSIPHEVYTKYECQLYFIFTVDYPSSLLRTSLSLVFLVTCYNSVKRHYMICHRYNTQQPNQLDNDKGSGFHCSGNNSCALLRYYWFFFEYMTLEEGTDRCVPKRQ